MNGDRSQVGIDVEQLAQREEPGLGAQRAGRAVQGWVADGPQQYRVTPQDRGARPGWQRIIRRGDARRTDWERLEREADVEALTDGFEHAHRLGDHLRAYAVARQHRDGIRLHV